MDQKEEFESIIKNADQSREKSLILLICAGKSLAGLQGEFERQEFSDEQTDQINQLLDCVDNLANLWLSKLADGKIKLEELVELIEESDLLNVFGNLFYRNLTQKFNKIEQILHKLFTSLPIAKDNQIPFYLYLMVITQRFKEENGMEKFELSRRLNGYLSRNLAFCLDNAKVQNCVQVLAESLYDVLQNKLSEELRAPIFSLLATIAYHYESLNWFIKPGDERRSFLLVSRLACIESRMCLETKLNDVNLLTNSLIIVEYSMKALIDDNADGTDEKAARSSGGDKNGDERSTQTVMEYLENDDVIQLIDAIKLLVQSIVIYLGESQSSLFGYQAGASSGAASRAGKIIELDTPNYDQFQVCLRVLCLYLTLENEFLSKEFEQVINIISGYILNELPKQSTRNSSLINLCLTAVISIVDHDLNKYKQQLVKLNLIREIESQLLKCDNVSESSMFKSFLDGLK